MALSSGPASKRRRLTNALVGFGLGSVLVLYFLSSVITYTILGQADMRSEVLLWALDGGDGGGDGVQPCADVSSAAACERVVAQGLCERDDSALRLCRQSCGLCVGGRVERRGDELAAAVRTTAEPANEASPPSFSRPCVDRNAACTAWANEGECDANPNYMRAECARSCYVCESDLCSDDNGGHCSALPLSECADKATAQRCPFRCGACGLVFSPRCARKPGIGPAKPAGALGRMFKALSAPGARPAARVLSADPYVLLFEDFLSDEEVDALVVKGGHHFERSLAGDGITPVRTSSTSWCNVPACEDDPTVQAVRERISRLVGIPWENAEHLQVLRYQPSEFYKSHHDQNALPESAWGVRLLTFFMYLSDVQEGGETHFVNLNISVKPKKGQAVLWPSVYDHAPEQTDNRTFHEAVAPISGVKLAANFWLHQFPFQSALANGCDNKRYFHEDSWRERHAAHLARRATA